MRAPGHRSFVVTIACCGLALAAGVATGLYGRRVPVFLVDFHMAQQAFMRWCTDEPRVNYAAGDRYLALFTNHYTLIDAGTGLVLVALTVAAVAFVLRLRSLPDYSWLRTPERPWTFLLLGVCVLVWNFLAATHSFETDLARMKFPPCADSIAIPIFETFIFFVLTTPILFAVGWGLTFQFGTLPAPLRQWDRTRPARSWVLTVIFGSAALLIGAALVDSIRSSMNFAAPALVLAIYLLSATRAALLSPGQAVAGEAAAAA
jgi:hypothetical protein